MKNKKKLWIVLFEDFEIDGRVQRQVAALKNKYNVKVFSANSDISRTDYLGVEFINLNQSYGFFTPILKLKHILVRLNAPDYIYCNNIYTVPVFLMFKLLFSKAKFIYDSHELIVPDPVTHKSIASKKSIFLEKLATKLSDLVVSTNRQRSTLMKEYYKLSTLPLAIENFVELSPGEMPERLLEYSPTKFIYQGVLKDGRFLHQIIEAFSLIPSVELHIYGFGDAESSLIKLAKEAGGFEKSIYFHGKLARDQLYLETIKYDAGLVVYDFSNMNNKYCSPNKTSEYVLSGLPILCTPQESLKELVDRTNVGSYFGYDDLESGNISAMSLKIIHFSKNINVYKENVRNNQHLFDFNAEANKLLEAIRLL